MAKNISSLVSLLIFFSSTQLHATANDRIGESGDGEVASPTVIQSQRAANAERSDLCMTSLTVENKKIYHCTLILNQDVSTSCECPYPAPPKAAIKQIPGFVRGKNFPKVQVADAAYISPNGYSGADNIKIGNCLKGWENEPGRGFRNMYCCPSKPWICTFGDANCSASMCSGK